MDKDFYNESSSAKLGWEPHWFGCDEFDDDLYVFQNVKQLLEEFEFLPYSL